MKLRGNCVGAGHWSIWMTALAAVPMSPALAQQQPAANGTPPAPILSAPVQTMPLPTLSAAQADQLAQALAQAGYSQGLRHDSPAPARPADNDALVRAALDYARAVHSGRLDASDFDTNWGLRPPAFDPLPGFADAVRRDRIAAWLRSLPPPYAGYDGLQKGLVAYRQIEANGGWSKLAAGPDLAQGASGARVVALRKRLAVEDPEVSPTGETFDAALKEAVVRAQRRYGLNPTGVVSTGTLAALNVSTRDRIRQIMANMERWRWLPAQLPAKRIQVNIAAAVMTVFEGDTPIFSMKAVTGRPGNETPMLQSRIHSIVLNPPWNVPTSIATKELWPKGDAYLLRNGYKIIGTGPNRRLQQQPGPRSALGLYKFDFDNSFSVYLHDTPAQAGFSRFSRLESHGCVRLEKPAQLAQLLLRNDPNWQPDRIQSVIDEGKTTRVSLQEQDKVAVFLLYWTAFAGTNGQMNFRDDPYGWDRALAEKIERRSAITAAVAAR